VDRSRRRTLTGYGDAVDLRVQTSLLAALVALALGGGVILRARTRRDQWLFGLFGLSVGTWYLSTFFAKLLHSPAWERINLAFGLLVPLAALRFFRAFVDEDSGIMASLHRAAIASGLVIGALLPTPLYDHIVVRTLLIAYVIVFLFASLAMLYQRAQTATSKFESARLMFLTLVGSLAGFFALLEYLPYVGLDIPPVGTILVLVFLYMLYQSMVRYRLIDLYELAGRLGALTALSFALAGILWLLFQFVGGQYFLHAVVASLVVLILFDPLRTKVSEQIGQLLFRERFDLERRVHDLRREVAHVLEVEELPSLLMEGLEASRRITHAGLYLMQDTGRAFVVQGSVGPVGIARVEVAKARPLLERLERDGMVVLETVERQLEESRTLGIDREAETLYEIAQTLEAMNASVALAVAGERTELYGMLVLRDERMRDAFSPEEVMLLQGLASQCAIALENSRLYQRLKERDRLAALGEMAAGLAHEIRNPLGAIKASAQYLSDDAPPEHEFLDIIVEEVDRLNRVVGSFLDYAKPARGNPKPLEINRAVERTMQLLAQECATAEVEVDLELGEEIPQVRLDVEQLRQVLINLVRNALQAMEGAEERRLIVSTGAIGGRVSMPGGASRRWVEVRVHDTGPGISDAVRETLFVPFVTTKQRGTGLGLPISQRIVSEAGGRILVRSASDEGTTFVVRFPAEDPVQAQPGEGAASAAEDSTESSIASSPSESDASSPSSESEPSPGAGELPSALTTSR